MAVAAGGRVEDLFFWLVALSLIPVALIAYDWFSRETLPDHPGAIALRILRRDILVNRWFASLVLTCASATMAAALVHAVERSLSVVSVLGWGISVGCLMSVIARNAAHAIRGIDRLQSAVYSKSDARIAEARADLHHHPIYWAAVVLYAAVFAVYVYAIGEHVCALLLATLVVGAVGLRWWRRRDSRPNGRRPT